MNQKMLTDLISIPLFAGVIGYLTNWTGAAMLLRPVRFHGIRLPGLRQLFPLLPGGIRMLPLISHTGAVGWQGLVPLHADEVAGDAADIALGMRESLEGIYRELQPRAIAAHLVGPARSQVRDAVERMLARENPQLWHDLRPVAREAVHARVRQQLPAVVAALAAGIGAELDQLLDVRLLLAHHFAARPALITELYLAIGRRELRFVQNLGFYLGVPMGFVLFGVVQVSPHWYVLPIGGVIVGCVVNYLGTTIIFSPARPEPWYPWQQGLLIKRQAQVARLYARTLADEVITVDNIGTELLRGVHSERTLQLLESALQPAVERAVRPARAAARAAIGTKEYDQIRDAMAGEASRSAPAVVPEAESDSQRRKIYEFAFRRMTAIGPDDLARLLHSAIKQDEWLLVVHGGVLGLLAGLLHLAMFGI